MTYDVAVIGGGIAGASAAWALAEHVRVLLVEREAQTGQHASGRSASVLSETSGHPAVCALATASRPFFEAPPDGFAEHPVLGPRGLLWIGRHGDDAALDALCGDASGGKALRLDASAAAALLPGFRPEAIAAGGVHEPRAMSIDVAALLHGFVAGLRARGGTVATSSEVVRLQRRRNGWRVHAGVLVEDVGAVVNASGAWGDVVATRAGVEPVGLTPLRRTAAIVPVPSEFNAQVARWPLVMDVANRFYVESEPGGLLLSPADENPSEPCDAAPEMLDIAIALDRLREATTVPVRSVRQAWAGLRTFAPDRVPVVGEDPSAPGFYWLAGQGGAGIKTAPALAAFLTALVLGQSISDVGVSPDVLSPARFRVAA